MKKFLLKVILSLALCTLLLLGVSKLPDLTFDFKSTINDILSPSPSKQKEQKETSDKSFISEEPALTIHFIDVGQGDATLITCNDQALLIDAGYFLFSEKVLEYVQKHAPDNTLDYIIATHPDADHVGGLPNIISSQLQVNKIFFPNCPDESDAMYYVNESISNKGLQKVVPDTGATYSLGDATFTFIGPLKKYDDRNNNSLCIKLTYYNTSYLFCGDAGEEAELDMIAAGYDLDCDVLKISHHGSKYSSCESFINATTPEYAVISVGENNDYFHPHATVLNILRKESILTYRTDEQGSIVLISDGNNINFNTPPSYSWRAGEGNNN